MNKIKLTIAVTGLNNTDNPGPGIPVIRSLRESEAFEPRIIGLAYENLEPGIYMSDHVDKVYQIPYPSEGSDPLINRVLEIHEKEKIDLLIPNFDAELLAFMKAADLLRSKGINTFLPTLKQFDERHKSNLPDYGRKYGVSVPKGRPLTGFSDLANVEKEFGYPAVIKGKFYDAYIAHNYEQSAVYYNKVAAKWGLPVVVQEFIRGTEVNVIALGDGKGNTVSAVPMRKLYITDKGKAWAGITLADDKMLELTRNLIARTNWRGGMELELIRADKGELYLIEINPRIPAWVYLAVGAGQNLPEALAKLALGMETTPFDSYKTGTMFIRYSYDLIKDISEFEKLTMDGEL
ncbi:MAG: ATP-grasp domain-containing protein [Bacteroidales bacterium]|nr:ATP-grasp domain-containing protein [Bacteroidales bacterium]